jgi:hypothetical protein
MNKYLIDVDEKTHVEIYADCIDIKDGVISFVRNHQTIAEFSTWRYWILEEAGVK